MAERSKWQGRLQVGGMWGCEVSIGAAAGGYDGDEGFKQVCECHHLPFKRTEICVGGKRRLTEALTKAGDTDNTTKLVSAIERDGKYSVVDSDQIKAINDAVSSKLLQCTYRVPLEEVPFHQFADPYYVRAQPGSEGTLAAIHQGLLETGEALVGQWTERTKPRMVVIHPAGDALIMNTIRYAAEWIDPDEKATAHLNVKVSDAEAALAVQLLGTLSDDPDWDSFESEAVSLKQKVVAAVLAGKPTPTSSAPAAAPVASSVLAQMQAALAAAKPAASKAKPKAKRQAAPAPRGSRGGQARRKAA